MCYEDLVKVERIGEAEAEAELARSQVIEEIASNNELRGMITRFKKMKLAFTQVGGHGNEGCLIYIALSKCKDESISHLRKQLYYMHLQLICAGTAQQINCLRQNPNYDLLSNNQVRNQMQPLAEYCKHLWRDTTAIMSLCPPLRLHPMTRGAINNIVSKYKRVYLSPGRSASTNSNNPPLEGMSADNPMLQSQVESEANEEEEESIYYYGLVLMDTTVVTIFKSNQDIQVAPQDISLILTHINITMRMESSGKKSQSYSAFKELCLPGMT